MNVQNNAPSQINNKPTQQDFEAKIRKLSADLETGTMWMNEKCEMQNKSSRFVRWIKCVLSTILPIDLFSSIKVNNVALAYFKFIKQHQDYLVDQDFCDDVKRVLSTLNERTKGRHALEMEVYKTAINGLFLEVNDELHEEEEIAAILKGMSDGQRFAFFEDFGINLPEAAAELEDDVLPEDVKVENIPQAVPAEVKVAIPPHAEEKKEPGNEVPKAENAATVPTNVAPPEVNKSIK